MEHLVQTSDGPVRGRRMGGLLAFLGLPYAAPPVGELRFRAPQPATPWEAPRDATEFGHAAIQPPMFTRTGVRTFHPISEDALTLNVITPGLEAARPVMVFIHGGAYSSGLSASPIYRGDRLAARGDIVFVSINYRLGPLGYLDFSEYSTPTRVFDGNLGLRDQVAALEWVRRNISQFGGDPAAVTIFGESAGGDSVTTLMATPAAKGLFARSISESSPPSLVNTAARARRYAREVLTQLDIDPSDAAERLPLADADRMSRAGGVVAARIARRYPGLGLYGPTIDGDFLPRPPIDVFRDGQAHRVPLIIGTNADEGTLFPRMLDVLPTTPSRIEQMFAATDPSAMARVVATYDGYPDAAACVQIGGDITFWWPSVEIASYHAAFAPTFMYRFDYAPKLMHLMGFGATHTSELFAVFGKGANPAAAAGPGPDLARAFTIAGGRRGLDAVTDSIQRQWLHFAEHAAPTAAWPAYEPNRRATFIFDEVSRVEDDPHGERRRAWTGYRGYLGQGL
jgi:para-nitrobenzyl esterase